MSQGPYENGRLTSLLQALGGPEPPAGFLAASVRLEMAGPALLRATVGLYRHDWIGTPPEPPFLAMSTYIADIRVAGLCS